MKIKTQLNPYMMMSATIAAVSGILFGFDTGVISGAILFIKTQFHLTDTIKEVVVSSVLIGALLGSLISGSFADRYGRRKLLIVTALIFILGTLGCTYATTIPILISSRFIVGFAIGIASFAAPLYISEISPREYRGALVSLNQLAVTVGILLAYLVDMAFANAVYNWRWMFACGIVPAVILFFGMLLLPRSPRWLVLVNKLNEAKQTLQKIRGAAYDDKELEEIEKTVVKHVRWTMLFQRWLMPALVVALGLALLQQFTGINTIIYYAPTLFQMAGVQSNSGAILATVGVGAVNVAFTILVLPLIDKWGRKPLLLTGMLAMLFSLLLMSLSFTYAAHAPYLRWFALASMLIFIAGFAIGLGPIMWLMFSEIFPLEIRGLAISLMACANWFFNFIVAQTFLTLIHAFGQSGTFLIYAAIDFFGILFVLFKVPETKGTTLEQIESNLRAGVGSANLGCATVPHKDIPVQ